MKTILPLLIITISCGFFTSCHTGKLRITNYYGSLNEQTVFVETAVVAEAAKCINTDAKSEEDNEICDMLLKKLPDIHGRYVGTGTFIRHHDKMRVLTAEHVCYPDEVPPTVKKDNITIEVKATTRITVRSRNFESAATIIKKDNKLDLCILEIDDLSKPPKVKPAKISRKRPKRGAHVHYAGAPFGMMSDEFLLTFDGIYSGALMENMIFSLPCASGASGSSIRNKKNEIVSMVQKVHVDFHHVCYGVDTKKLRDFLLN